MKYDFNDGGRAAAGFKGQTSDCVTRSIAIVTGIPYKEVYDELNRLSKEAKLGVKLVKNAYGSKYQKVSSSRTGVSRRVYEPYLKSLGFVWVPMMGIGTGCKCHLKDNELPSGRLIVRLSRHLTTVIDGVVNDTFDPSREGTRCVYGYYYKPL